MVGEMELSRYKCTPDSKKEKKKKKQKQLRKQEISMSVNSDKKHESVKQKELWSGMLFIGVYKCNPTLIKNRAKP